jgi:quercetin dioxygenase-like cupin family protein
MSAVAHAIKALRFVTSANARVEFAWWGKHWWLSQPGLTDTKQLTLVRVRMRPGAGHQFHYHPAREEILYVLDGVAEQWVDREKRRLKAGDIAFIPKNVVHAIHNPSKTRSMSFLAILSPANAKGPFLVDCYDDEPWRSLRKPFAYGDVDPRTGRRKRFNTGSTPPPSAPAPLRVGVTAQTQTRRRSSDS